MWTLTWVLPEGIVGRRGSSIAYVIAEPCIDVKDKACVEVCPVTAIFAEDEVPEPSRHFIELNKQFFVDNPGVQPCTTRK